MSTEPGPMAAESLPSRSPFGMLRRLLWPLLPRWILCTLLVLQIGPWLWLVATEERARTVSLPELRASLDSSQGPRTLWVVADAWHTSLLFERPRGYPGPADWPDAPFVEVAYGERAYFQGGERGAWAQFRAAVLPSDGTIHMRGWRTPPDPSHMRFVRLDLPESDLVRLLEDIESRIAVGGREAPLPPSQLFPGTFYPAHEAYVHWRNCNAWTGARLAHVGLLEDDRFLYGAIQLLERLAPGNDANR